MKRAQYLTLATVTAILLVITFLPEVNKELFVEPTGRFGASPLISILLIIGLFRNSNFAINCTALYFFISLSTSVVFVWMFDSQKPGFIIHLLLSAAGLAILCFRNYIVFWLDGEWEHS